MGAREVRIALNHARAFPSAQLLQDVQRRPGLGHPACPGVAQVVPAEVDDSSPFQRLVPRRCVALLDQAAVEGKHMGWVRANPAPNNCHGIFVQRYGVFLTVLELIA